MYIQNIYIVTLFDDTQFISINLNQLAQQLNLYFKEKNITDLNKNIYVVNVSMLKHRLFDNIRLIYPFKDFHHQKALDYFEKELIELHPDYHKKKHSTHLAYLKKLLKSKNLI